MKPYHKIQTVFKRDPNTNYKTLLEGDYSLPEFEYLAQNKWVFTEKVDGTNIRIIFNGTSIIVAGRTNKDQLPEKTISLLNTVFQPKLEYFKEFFKDGICLYGESYRAKTTKGGRNYCQDQDFVLFDIKIGGWWLQRLDVIDIGIKLQLRIIPIVMTGNLNEMVKLAKEGFDSVWGNFQAEGIVARPATELQTRGGQRIITKIKCKDFR